MNSLQEAIERMRGRISQGVARAKPYVARARKRAAHGLKRAAQPAPKGDILLRYDPIFGYGQVRRNGYDLAGLLGVKRKGGRRMKRNKQSRRRRR